MLAAGDCWPNLQDRNSEKNRLELFQNGFPMVKLMTRKEERERERDKDRDRDKEEIFVLYVERVLHVDKIAYL